MIKYKGLRVITSRNAYEPAEDTFLAAEVLEFEIGKSARKDLSVLDMGSGTGILGLVAAINERVKTITFADINPKAVALTRENIAFSVDTLKAEYHTVESDLFANIKGTFDIIIFNAPYLRDDKKEDKKDDINKAWAGGREGIEESVRFLKQSTDHLNSGGKIILIASSLGNLEKLKSEISEIGYVIDSEKKIHIFFEDIVAFVLKKK